MVGGRRWWIAVSGPFIAVHASVAPVHRPSIDRPAINQKPTGDPGSYITLLTHPTPFSVIVLINKYSEVIEQPLAAGQPASASVRRSAVNGPSIGHRSDNTIKTDRSCFCLIRDASIPVTL
jgi:hypothetical protein